MESEFYPKDDHSFRTWKWNEWLMHNGAVTEENVMEYFEDGIFFDKTSNNNVLLMQTRHTESAHRMSRQETETELRKFTGMEYALVHAKPPLFVIQQRDRLSPTEVRPTAVYFVLNNVMYAAPDLYTLISAKLSNALDMIQSSLDTLRQARPDYTPRIGHAWPIVESPVDSLVKKSRIDTRQGSAVPGTPGGELSVNAALAEKPPTAPPENNEEEFAWEPFASAFMAVTRYEVEHRKRLRTMAATDSAVPMDKDPQDHSNRTSKPAPMMVPPAVTPESRVSRVIAGAAPPKVSVPIADTPPTKLKNTPGPPGKPGEGKKKKRRLAAQAAKNAAAAAASSGK